MLNALTVDVEEYFHVSNFEGVIDPANWDAVPSRLEAALLELVELLEQGGAKGTFFFLGWVAERAPRLVERVFSAGFEIASHGYSHRRVHEMSPSEFEEDLGRAEEVIAAVTGVRVRGFRAPSFSIRPDDPWAMEILIDRGYTYDSSLFPSPHPEYGFSAMPSPPVTIIRKDGKGLVEFPPAVMNLGCLRIPAGGGGYFRLLPYRFTSAILLLLNRAGRSPFTFYIHPWEIDPEQPRLNLPPLKRFRHYTGLKRTSARLKRLLKDFRFTTLQNIVEVSRFGEKGLDEIFGGMKDAK